MKIYLIRHSESVDDIQDCYGGIADFELTENGKRKVENYREEIKKYGIQKIYSSPYKRAYQTAQIFKKDIKEEIEVVENIRELNQYGILSGVNKKLAKDIFSYVLNKEEYKNIGYYNRKTFLGGEDIKEFDNRVKSGMEYIISSSENLQTIAIVTHGGVYRSIYKNILNIDKKIEQIEDLATTILDFEDNKFRISDIQGIRLGEKIV